MPRPPPPAKLLQTHTQVRLREGPPRRTLVRSPESLLSLPCPLPCRPLVVPASLAKVAVSRGSQHFLRSTSPLLGAATLAPSQKGRGSDQAEDALVLLPPAASLCREAAASGKFEYQME